MDKGLIGMANSANISLSALRDGQRARVAALHLSGGMRRRVSLARAVAFPSDLVVLDEPFTGLDQATKEKVIAFALRHRAGRTLLVATHGQDDARLLGAERINLVDVQDGGVGTA